MPLSFMNGIRSKKSWHWSTAVSYHLKLHGNEISRDLTRVHCLAAHEDGEPVDWRPRCPSRHLGAGTGRDARKTPVQHHPDRQYQHEGWVSIEAFKHAVVGQGYTFHRSVILPAFQNDKNTRWNITFIFARCVKRHRKWSAFCRRHFQMYLFCMKVLIFWMKFNWNLKFS